MYKKLTIICILFVCLFFLISQAVGKELAFSSPFVLHLKHGGKLYIKSIKEDSDVDGSALYIYVTTEGQEGFSAPSNIANLDDLNDALHPPSVSPKKNTPRYSESKKDGKSTTASRTPAQAGSTDIDAKTAVAILNTMYGKVCVAELNGIFTKTLKINWTSATMKIHAMKVLAEIGTIKDGLYLDGVRYFQFPNDAGTYNVIDWKTGNKKSISDRAPYYFAN